MPLPRKSSPVRRVALRTEVYARLRDWIVEGQLQPGEILRDADLAARLEVSRTPVREALLRLQEEGLVESSAQRWTRVGTIHFSRARNLIPIIQSLERLALQLALPRMEASHLRTLRRESRALATALRARDAVAASRADGAFHAVFAEASGNQDLVDLLANLGLRHRWVEIAYFSNESDARLSVAEHEALVGAIESGQLSRATAALDVHWNHALERIAARASAVDSEALRRECKKAGLRG